MAAKVSPHRRAKAARELRAGGSEPRAAAAAGVRVRTIALRETGVKRQSSTNIAITVATTVVAPAMASEQRPFGRNRG